MLSWNDLRTGLRFTTRLPRFLREPIDTTRARAILGRRFQTREADFLSVAERAAFRPDGPYRALLESAGCTLRDLTLLAEKEGVEGALLRLYDAGVYLTVEEFKGRSPIVRGSRTITLDPDELWNPASVFHLQLSSSGSRGEPRPVMMDLAYIADRAVDTALVTEARGGLRWEHAIWGVPGGSAMVRILEFARFGSPLRRWFSQVDPAAEGLHPRYRWSARAMRAASALAGRPLPAPQHVPLDQPDAILRWMRDVLNRGGTPHLQTFASSGVRLCHAARDQGVDIRGARFQLGGEPSSEARLREIRRAGVEAMPCYASMECGPIGYGCLDPSTADDMHLLEDLHAVVWTGAPKDDRSLPSGALLISSLRPTAPMLLLNVSLGDRAHLGGRRCGCPLEELGWAAHLNSIRSFGKLTAGGMTFLDRDVVPVLEETLPARFGGGPTSYQLVEEESEQGHPRLRLLADPALGPLDAEELADAFLRALGEGSGARRVMGLQWRQARFLEVERRAPLRTPSGKVPHVRRLPAGAAEEP